MKVSYTGPGPRRPLWRITRNVRASDDSKKEEFLRHDDQPRRG
jgi:hypothetical protein